jgi:NADH-quinone oxidoreductase subunit L
VAYVGGFTALFAATMGLTAFDIKRVLAFSTVSQLGFMMLGLGVGAVMGAFSVGVAMFHLIGHSFFKALLFLCAGSVIHAVGTNDMREMGAVGKYMKWTAATMAVGGLALAGFPLTTGFYSKDEIIVTAWEYGLSTNQWIPYIFAIVAALMTAFYTFRLWFVAFTGEPRSDYHKHESPWVMLGPLVILAIFALGFGIAAQSGFYEAVGNNFEHYGVDFEELAIVGGHAVEGQGEGHGAEGEAAAEGGEAEPAEPFIIKILPILVGVGGILLAALCYYWRKIDTRKITGPNDPIRAILLKGYYQHEIYTAWFAETVVYGIALICNMIDNKIVDGILNKISDYTVGFAGSLRKVQTGVVQNYVAALVLGIVVLVVVVKLAMEVGL